MSVLSVMCCVYVQELTRNGQSAVDALKLAVDLSPDDAILHYVIERNFLDKLVTYQS